MKYDIKGNTFKNTLIPKESYENSKYSFKKRQNRSELASMDLTKSPEALNSMERSVMNHSEIYNKPDNIFTGVQEIIPEDSKESLGIKRKKIVVKPDNKDTYYSPRLEVDYEDGREDVKRKFNSVTYSPMIT